MNTLRLCVLRRILLAMLASVAVASAVAAPSFRRGLNIANWLSQNGDGFAYGADWFQEKDVAWIAAQGFDHIRYPIDMRVWFREDGSIDESKVAPFTRALEWTRKYKLGAILDAHSFAGADFAVEGGDSRVYTDPVLMERAAKMWRTLAQRYAKEDGYLRFELLNEPKAEKNAQLNVLNLRLLKAIRESNPTRVVYFATNRWNKPANVVDLELPQDDPNVAVTVHYYQPMVFTHQKADWYFTRGTAAKLPPIHFPGKVPDLSGIMPAGHDSLKWSGRELSVEKDIDPVFDALATWAKEKAPGREVHLGEFGVFFEADPTSTIAWTRAVRKACERHGFAWAAWAYKNVFPVRTMDDKPAPMLEGLMKE